MSWRYSGVISDARESRAIFLLIGSAAMLRASARLWASRSRRAQALAHLTLCALLQLRSIPYFEIVRIRIERRCFSFRINLLTARETRPDSRQRYRNAPNARSCDRFRMMFPRGSYDCKCIKARGYLSYLLFFIVIDRERAATSSAIAYLRLSVDCPITER